MLAAAALAIAAAPAPALPSRAQVREAMDHAINSGCGSGIESENCVSHPSAVSVRRVSCVAEAPSMARCRYQRRVHPFFGQARWEPAETRFAYDGARQAWFFEREFPLAPERANVEGALHWQAGALCRMLIDDCLDGDGNEINPLPQFTVSALECRPAGNRRATCSFTSVRHFGPRDALPGERCTGTLERRDHDRGETSWNFVVPDPWRRPYAALLRCHSGAEAL